jgi:hypothetical protein
LALSCEDLNDHKELRNDPPLEMLTRRRDLAVPGVSIHTAEN